MRTPAIVSLLIVFSFLILWAPVCVASEPTPADVVITDGDLVEKNSFSIFQRMFFGSEYNSLKCQENIYKLLVEIRKANLDLSQVKVVYVFNRDHHKLVPTKSFEAVEYGVQRSDITAYQTRIVPTREPPPNEFRYHVFAMVRGRALDFDYTNSPVFEELATYFDRMFTPGQLTAVKRRKLFEQLSTRVIPSEEYIKDHPRHPSYYLFDLADKYTSRSVGKFLESVGL